MYICVCMYIFINYIIYIADKEQSVTSFCIFGEEGIDITQLKQVCCMLWFSLEFRG